jgi:hypothetical protein
MGLSISALINEWLGDKKARILCVGLDCAGKVCSKDACNLLID